MERFLKSSGLDARFVDLTILMTLGVWPWLAFWTLGIAFYAWKLVLTCQFIALPFAVIGWSVGFRAGVKRGWDRQTSTMLAGWAALCTASAGLSIWLWAIYGSGLIFYVLISFPFLALLMTVGIKIFYRASTWTGGFIEADGNDG
jgi:hypothetical protein